MTRPVSEKARRLVADYIESAGSDKALLAYLAALERVVTEARPHACNHLCRLTRIDGGWECEMVLALAALDAEGGGG